VLLCRKHLVYFPGIRGNVRDFENFKLGLSKPFKIQRFGYELQRGGIKVEFAYRFGITYDKFNS